MCLVFFFGVFGIAQTDCMCFDTLIPQFRQIELVWGQVVPGLWMYFSHPKHFDSLFSSVKVLLLVVMLDLVWGL